MRNGALGVWGRLSGGPALPTLNGPVAPLPPRPYAAMSLLRTGTRGPQVELLQALLNRRFGPRPKLVVDGIFGPKTEAAVEGFQGSRGLKVDGLVGPNTWGALRSEGTGAGALPAPPPRFAGTGTVAPTAMGAFVGPLPPPTAPHGAVAQQTPGAPQGGGSPSTGAGPVGEELRKFVGLVGSAADFVQVVRGWERTHGRGNRKAVMQAMFKSGATPTGERYMVIRRTGDPKILDMIHFFTMASLTYTESKQPTPFGTPMDIGGGKGDALWNGVANEVVQCVDEGTAFKLNSCFAKEDLSSNRLGVEFGERVVRSGTMPSRRPISQMLDQFLAELNPAPPRALRTVKLPTHADVATELFTTVLLGTYEIVVPSAY